MDMQKVWTPFNITSLMELPAYQISQPHDDKRSSHFHRDLESKKTRTCFSRAQVAVLEERFKTQKYITQTERCQLAEQLNMTDNQVKTWFQNRRTKWRRQESDQRYAKPQSNMHGYIDYEPSHQ